MNETLKQITGYIMSAQVEMDKAMTLVNKLAVANFDKENAPVETADEEVTGNIISYLDENEEEVTVDLDSMTLKELKAFAGDCEIELTAKKKDGIIAEIMEAFSEEEEGDDDGEESTEESEDDDEENGEEADDEEEEVLNTVIELEDGESIDLAEMNVKELRKLAKDWEIELTSKTKDEIIEEILEAVNGDDEEESEEEPEEDDEDAEDEDDPYGLTAMTQEELADICAEHGLSVKGKREALISRIEKAIEDGTIELSDSEDDEDEEEGE